MIIRNDMQPVCKGYFRGSYKYMFPPSISSLSFTIIFQSRLSAAFVWWERKAKFSKGKKALGTSNRFSEVC